MAETGIEVENACVVRVVQQSGICDRHPVDAARPDPSHRTQFVTDVTAWALTFQRKEWLKKEWDFLGVGMSGNATEVHTWHQIPSKYHVQVAASNCSVVQTKCPLCVATSIAVARDHMGRMAVLAFNNTAPSKPFSGYVSNDIAFAFEFDKNETSKVLKIRALEAVIDLGHTDINRTEEVLQSRRLTLNGSLFLKAMHIHGARQYDIQCDEGLSEEVMKTLAIYRLMQMRYSVSFASITALHQLPPITPTDVLKAIFSLHAAHLERCSAPVGHYSQCGSYRWDRGFFMASIAAFFVLLWFVLVIITKRLAIDLPYDASTWIEYISQQSDNNVRIERNRNTGHIEAFLVPEEGIAEDNGPRSMNDSIASWKEPFTGSHCPSVQPAAPLTKRRG